MTIDPHSAVRTAVDEARQLAQEVEVPDDWVAYRWPDVDNRHIEYWSPTRALAMCDWADDVLARHTPEPWSINVPDLVCTKCVTGDRDCYQGNDAWPCAELISVAAAFGVETGETP